MSTPAEPTPVLFLGHGNPLVTLSTNRYTAGWRLLGASLPRPRAVLCISAHWYVDEIAVTAAAAPETIHDFHGFPDELFRVTYPAPGSPALAQRIGALLHPAGVRAAHDWGLDHGAWAVLSHLLPKADIPVVQLSLDARLAPSEHQQLGERLRPLRADGVLIVGSGNVVHNLRQIDRDPSATPYPWAVSFEATVAERIARHDIQALVDYPRLSGDALLAAPTPDHYLPLLYCLGATTANDAVSFPIRGIEHRSVSMLCVRWG